MDPVMVTFATYMVETLIRAGVLPPPQSANEAEAMVGIVLVEFANYIRNIMPLVGAAGAKDTN